MTAKTRHELIEEFREWVNSHMQLYPDVWPGPMVRSALAEIDELRRRCDKLQGDAEAWNRSYHEANHDLIDCQLKCENLEAELRRRP